MLYHYTSLATFALILTTKSIKFNRLDLVDDPDESLFGYGIRHEIEFIFVCFVLDRG